MLSLGIHLISYMYRQNLFVYWSKVSCSPGCLNLLIVLSAFWPFWKTGKPSVTQRPSSFFSYKHRIPWLPSYAHKCFVPTFAHTRVSQSVFVLSDSHSSLEGLAGLRTLWDLLQQWVCVQPELAILGRWQETGAQAGGRPFRVLSTLWMLMFIMTHPAGVWSHTVLKRSLPCPKADLPLSSSTVQHPNPLVTSQKDGAEKDHTSFSKHRAPCPFISLLQFLGIPHFFVTPAWKTKFLSWIWLLPGPPDC